MPHRYSTRYQSKIANHLSVPSYDENKPSDTEIQLESYHCYEHDQEALLSALIPQELEEAIQSILDDHYRRENILSTVEMQEAQQINNIIDHLKSNTIFANFMTYHYPIICRLEANIELFTYMKYNHELIRRFHYLANIYHNYYSHFSILYSTLWNEYTDASKAPYKDLTLQYCALLSTLKNAIHHGEMLLIDEKLLKHY